MKEDFLHYVWKFKKFDFLNVESAAGEPLHIFQTGIHNQTQSGPDFFNAKIKIGKQLWAGNVEIHLKSSDWYAHHHETDPAYDNVILHVVWEYDVAVYRRDNSVIPTLVLKTYIAENALKNYQQLLGLKTYKWINCEKDFPDFSNFELNNWLERLYIERLEEKSKVIRTILKETTNNWEATLFRMLAKNFGLNVNGEAFLSMAGSFPYAVIGKIKTLLQMEALFFGQTGMLAQAEEGHYFKKLKAEYAYLQHKFKLSKKGVLPISYFRLRPQNFPTIRLSQLAVLLMKHKNLFSLLIENSDLKSIRTILKVETSQFWQSHYTFKKESKSSAKKLSNRFMDLVIINTIVPLRFCYFSQQGQREFDALFALMRKLPPEKNRITRGFNKLRPKTAENAFESQALIQLKKNYCDKNHCLHCNLGMKILQKESL